MIVIVNAGENIPADGIICKGNSNIDVSLITGESIPQLVKNGEKVFAGTTNLTKIIHLHVTTDNKNNLLNVWNMTKKNYYVKVLKQFFKTFF